MKTTYGLDSIIEDGRYKGKTVEYVIEKNKKEIFKLIKEKGYSFDNEVLEKCSIKRTVKDVKVESVVTEHEKDNNTYEKDTMSVNRILKAISTIENGELYFSDIESSVKSEEPQNEEKDE